MYHASALCTLLKLEMKLLTLKKSSLEKEEVNNPGRKTEEHEQVKEDKGAEADKLEEKIKIRKEDCIEGGGVH